MGDLVKYKANDGVDITLSLDFVRDIIAGGQKVPDSELYGFMAKCQARRLNPLAGDAYLTVYGGKATVTVSKDYWLRTAAAQPTFDGFKAGVVVVTADGTMVYREGCIVGKQTERLVGAWAEVYDKNRRVPIRAEVSRAEYDQGHSLWKTKPATMLRKVALVQALREAYPNVYGGLYDEDEMPAPDVPAAPTTIEPDVIEGEPEEPAADEEE